ncbi:unnamed protein product [Sphagnum compactum]
MYAKCGSLEDAWGVFNKIPSQVVVTWSTMILGHVKCRQGQKALDYFDKCNRKVYSSSSHHSNWFGDECLCGE